MRLHGAVLVAAFEQGIGWVERPCELRCEGQGISGMWPLPAPTCQGCRDARQPSAAPAWLQAYAASIVAPNKHTAAAEKMYKGHLLESETYIGGKVEAIESGERLAGAAVQRSSTVWQYSVAA